MKEQNKTPVSYTGKHIFTQSEKDAKLQQMLNAMRLKQEIEDELKTTKSTYKAKIDSKEAEIKLMQNLLMAGAEDRVYQTILTMDFADGKKFYHEVGTNILIGTEDLTAADRQMQMELDQKNIKANNKLADELQLDVEEKLEEAGFTIEPAGALTVVQDEPVIDGLSDDVELLGEAVVRDKPLSEEEITAAEAGPEVPDDTELFDFDESPEEDDDNPFNF